MNEELRKGYEQLIETQNELIESLKYQIRLLEEEVERLNYVSNNNILRHKHPRD